MLQATRGPHSPLVASAGSAESAIADEVAVASRAGELDGVTALPRDAEIAERRDAVAAR